MPKREASSRRRGARWGELFRDGRGAYTLLLNLGVALHAIHLYLLSTIMPTVVSDLGGAALYSWPTMLYMVGTIVGAAGGQAVRSSVGPRAAFVLGAIVFAIGAAGCGAAPTMHVLLVTQLIQGLGGGLMMSLSMVFVSVFYQGAQRTLVLSIVSTTWGIAALIGPAVGGAFAEFGWWRGAFWMSVPVILAFAAASWVKIPRSDSETLRTSWPLIRLGLLALSVLLIGIAGQFESLSLRGALVVGAVILVWLTFRLDRTASHALFPKRVMSVFTPVGVAYWVFFLVSMMHTSVGVFLPLLLQVVHDVSPLWVGYYLTLFSMAWTVGALLVAGWTGRWVDFAMYAGFAVCAVSLSGISVGAADAPLWLLGALVAALGIGIGMANVHSIAWAMGAASESEQTVTASATPAIRSLGNAFGAAIAGLVANAMGLGAGLERDTVATAMSWVYGVSAVPAVLSIYCIWRMIRLKGRVQTQPGVA